MTELEEKKKKLEQEILVLENKRQDALSAISELNGKLRHLEEKHTHAIINHEHSNEAFKIKVEQAKEKAEIILREANKKLSDAQVVFNEAFEKEAASMKKEAELNGIEFSLCNQRKTLEAKEVEFDLYQKMRKADLDQLDQTTKKDLESLRIITANNQAKEILQSELDAKLEAIERRKKHVEELQAELTSTLSDTKALEESNRLKEQDLVKRELELARKERETVDMSDFFKKERTEIDIEKKVLNERADMINLKARELNAREAKLNKLIEIKQLEKEI